MSTVRTQPRTRAELDAELAVLRRDRDELLASIQRLLGEVDLLRRTYATAGRDIDALLDLRPSLPWSQGMDDMARRIAHRDMPTQPCTCTGVRRSLSCPVHRPPGPTHL